MPITFTGDLPSSTERVQTKSWSLNYALRDVLGNVGYPLRSLLELYGPKGCLAGDTFISYEIRSLDGKRQNHKGGTLKHLYERFNGIETKGLGYYQRPETIDSQFYVSSIDENGLIFKNLIADVVYSGFKQTYKVELESGEIIVCTPDHELLSTRPQDKLMAVYNRLDSLNVGDTLYVHNNTHYKVENKSKNHYKESTVKYHPFGNPKMVSGCQYYRIRYSHLVYEADMNGLSVKEFRHMLNTFHPRIINEGLKFVDTSKFDIHHWDENSRNDVPDNLIKLTKKDHLQLHTRKNNSKFSRRIVVPSKIVSIIPQTMQDVYDIKCFAPYNNFVANSIVVHNCGKTTFSLDLLGTIAKERGKGVTVLDFEIQNRDTVSGILENTGFDGEVHYIQNVGDERPEDTVERFCDRMFDIHGKNKTYENPDVGLMDSIGAFRPMAELEGAIGDANMGIKAREMGQISSRYIRSLQLSKSPGTIIMTNHEHPNMSIGFGKPAPITSGGETKKYLSQIRIRLVDAYLKNSAVKFEGAWLIEGKVNENRFGISDQKFYAFMLGGQGVHQGLTAMFECLAFGYAESSAQALRDSTTISLDGQSFGKIKNIIRDRNDDGLFKPFLNALKANALDKEVEETEEDEKPKKGKKSK